MEGKRRGDTPASLERAPIAQQKKKNIEEEDFLSHAAVISVMRGTFTYCTFFPRPLDKPIFESTV